MKSRISLSLDADLLGRIDAAADAIGATRSFTVATLARRALEALAGEGGGDGGFSTSPPPPGAVIVEIDPTAPRQHVAIAETLAEAAELARARGLRWAAAGQPHELAATLPPLETTAAICATVALASALAVSPNWHRCSPQLARYGFTK
jgi:hypothetical protein